MAAKTDPGTGRGTESATSPAALSDKTSFEANQGRKSELYNAHPWDDGLYHCHYEGQDSCTHKPTNLKCNYE